MGDDERQLSSDDRDRNEVLQLDALRKQRGYKLGWLYYRCKEAGLVETFKQLEQEGLIGEVIHIQLQRSMEDTFRKSNETTADQKPIRLTVELVPETCWFTNVRSVVQPDEWQRLKQITYRKARYRCEVCSGRGEQWPVECHERWQYDDDKHIQRLMGLIALCPVCHEVKHRGFANISGRKHSAAQHLAKVNGWTMEEALAYIQAQCEVWEQRSQWTWQLDIRWLEQFGITIKPSVKRRER